MDPTHIIIYKDDNWSYWDCVPVRSEHRLKLELGTIDRLNYDEVRVLKVASETIIKQTQPKE